MVSSVNLAGIGYALLIVAGEDGRVKNIIKTDTC